MFATVAVLGLPGCQHIVGIEDRDLAPPPPDAGPADACTGASCQTTVRPVSPCGNEFMYQGRQDRFAAGGGLTCTGTVAIAVLDGEPGAPVVCYARGDGELVCGGRLAGRTYDFDTPAGVSDVVQVLSFGSDALCALSADGTAWCVGSNNDTGSLGTGGTEPVSSFAQWGAAQASEIGAIVALGTDGGGAICALTTAGDLFCSGHQMGAGTSDALTPVPIAADVAAFFLGDGGLHYQTTDGDQLEHFGAIDQNLASAFTACRVSAGRSEYLVTAPGIVDGAQIGPMPDGTTCVLGDTGLLQCGLGLAFGGTEVLAFAAKLDDIEPAVFGVRADGAVVGDVGIEVRGPGSARVPSCE